LAIFSFNGIEVIAVTSGEAQNPRVAIPAALRTMVFRLALFYLLALTIIVTTVPWTTTGVEVVAQSPFVTVFRAFWCAARGGHHELRRYQRGAVEHEH